MEIDSKHLKLICKVIKEDTSVIFEDCNGEEVKPHKNKKAIMNSYCEKNEIDTKLLLLYNNSLKKIRN